MSPLLRGESSTTTKKGLLKLLDDFIAEAKGNVLEEDENKFCEAYDAQIGNNIGRARVIYGELLAKYPNNKAIEHNLAQI